MLQLIGTVRNASSRLTPISYRRMPSQQLIAACSGNATPSPVLLEPKEQEPQRLKPPIKEIPISKNPKIQAAFDTLKITQLGPQTSNRENSKIERELKTSSNVRGLLRIVDEQKVTSQNAYAIVTLLIDWVNNGEAKLSDFELDSRFLYLCDLISQSKAQNTRNQSQNALRDNKYLNDLNLFLGINEIDEATKEVANITVNQMTKVMAALAQQKRRTTPLLRSLTFNISRCSDVLNVKQLSDILYSMAVLNYPDEVLLQKISNDLMHGLHQIDKSAIVGSILTSLGILRYKNEQLMDEFSLWAVKHSKNIRSQDLCALFMTLATIGYTPINAGPLKTELVESLKESDMTKPAEWLDLVWALTVLRLSKYEHIASVLDSTFLAKLADTKGIGVPKQHKLLNINGVAKFLLTDYKGPFLKSNSVLSTSPIQSSKEKQTFVRSVTSAVGSIFPAPEYLKLNVDFGSGFLLDAEFCINNKGERLPVACDVEKNKGLRVAVVSLCYNDLCRGKQDPLGCYDMYSRILKAKGYKILLIPYTEFNTDDKIVQRILYVKNRIKNIIAT